MGHNRLAQERARTAARAAAEAKRAEAERKAVADAQKVVAIWNARQAGTNVPKRHPAFAHKHRGSRLIGVAWCLGIIAWSLFLPSSPSRACT
jgi:hypothetical protein